MQISDQIVIDLNSYILSYMRICANSRHVAWW